VAQPGRIALDFTREGASAQAAITSALADVRKAIPDAKLIEVSPDLVGLTDVAELVGVTRQNMRQADAVARRGLSDAGARRQRSPVGTSACAAMAEGKGTYDIEQSVLDVAHAAMQINLAKQIEQLAPRARKQVRALLP